MEQNEQERVGGEGYTNIQLFQLKLNEKCDERYIKTQNWRNASLPLPYLNKKKQEFFNEHPTTTFVGFGPWHEYNRQWLLK